jgi:hypothetical protein
MGPGYPSDVREATHSKGAGACIITYPLSSYGLT